LGTDKDHTTLVQEMTMTHRPYKLSLSL